MENERFFVQKSTRRRCRGGSISIGTQRASQKSPANWMGAAGMRMGNTRPPVCRAMVRASSACETERGPAQRPLVAVEEVLDEDEVVVRAARPHDRVTPPRDGAEQLQQARLPRPVD